MSTPNSTAAEKVEKMDASEGTPTKDAEVTELRPAEQASPEKSKPKKGNSRRVILMAAVPLLLIGAGLWVWLTGGRYEETDNAYATQTKTSISADVSGRVETVDVSKNQLVKAGDVLFTLDKEPYEIALKSAKADLAKARLDVEQLKVSYKSALATLDSAKSRLDVQQELYDRREILAEKGVTSNSTLDELKLSLLQIKSAVISAEQTVATSLSALGGNPDIAVDEHPLVLAALADLDQAQRNLDKTTVYAPSDGIITQIDDLNIGQYVTAGSSIATVFATDHTWIEANFKETQLEGIKIGMPVEVVFDAYPSTSIHGKVTSITPGTGAEFSLIPAQNATGNWVKVVQRVPVIVEMDLDEQSPRLASGLSAVVKVDKGHSTLDKLRNL